MKTLYWTLVLPFAGLVAGPAAAQESGLDQILSGRSTPLSISPKDLNGDFRRMVVNDQSEMGNLQMLFIGAKTGVEFNLYFTKGETVSIGGEIYLIAYRPQTRIDPQIFNGHGPRDDKPAPPQKLRPNAKLALSLLNLRTTSSLNDIRPFDAKLDVESPGESDAATVRTLQRLGRDVLTWVRTRGRGKFPVMGAQVTPQLIQALYPQVHDRRQWQHPATDAFFRPNPALSGQKIGTVKNPRYVVMFSEASPSTDGTRAVLFVDGHVERVNAERWKRLQDVTTVEVEIVTSN